jgi:nicotinate-nucleotide adenylyltransferase
MMQALGIFGGTFDPVHYGHLRSALELRHQLALDAIHFVPCAHPPHRELPTASAETRLRMLHAAVDTEQGFVVDPRELERPGPSYTVDTLASFRDEFPRASLNLILGMDAFLGLPAWRAWRELLDLAHLVIAHRPGSALPSDGELGELLRDRRTRAAGDLKQALAGRVHIEAVTQLEISSTDLRAAIGSGLTARYLLPDAVLQVIVETGCYAV